MTSDNNAIIWEQQPQNLRRPLMIAGFEGWNDGGSAASSSVERMIKAFEADRFARLDPEEFYVFSESRPTVTLLDGTSRRIDWQTNDFFSASLPGAGRDVVLFKGTEPNLRWRGYCANLLSVAQALNVETVVTLGAYLADVLYTLPVQVTGFSNRMDLHERYDVRPSNYEGPTGIVGVFGDYCRQRDVAMLSLWGGVPYYISIPNPKAVHALVSKLRTIFGFEMDLAELESEADNFDNEINDVVAKDPNVAAYVRELKKREFLN